MSVATERLYHAAKRIEGGYGQTAPDDSELLLGSDERAAFLAYPVGAELPKNVKLPAGYGADVKQAEPAENKAIEAPDADKAGGPAVEPELVPVPDDLDTAAKVIGWIGDDKVRAASALAAEGDEPRKGIVKRVEKVLNS